MSGAGHFGDFLQPEAVLHAQHERRALLVGQVLQRPLQAAALFELAEHPVGAFGLGGVELAQHQFGFLAAGLRSMAAHQVDRKVVADLQQPGRELGLGPVALAGDDDAAPGFLEQLVGAGALAAMTQQKAVQGATVARVQRFERVRVAAPVVTVLLGVWLTFFKWLGPSIDEKHAYGVGVTRAHEPIGRWLAEQKTSRRVVAALDVGAIAFHSGWSVVDTWGLNDPQFALSAAKGRSYEDVLARDPSVIIVISGQREVFEPLFDYEGPLYREALQRGFRLQQTYEFTPHYFLWVLINPSAFRP